MIKKNKILYAVLIYITFVVLSIGFISACDLNIIKSSDKSLAEPGEVITFTLAYENVGEGNCTGGGVKIQDVLEDKLEYNGNYNIDIINDFDDEGVYYGWQGIPGFNETSKTLTWNAHIVSPGERGEITFEAIVLEGEEECVDFEVSNFFSSWSDQEGWKDSNTVTIHVNNECPEPCCGNGVVDVGEECDLEKDNGIPCTPTYGGSCTYCSGTCESITLYGGYCGDNILQEEYEECEDGNNVDGDGCSAECEIEEDGCPCPGCYIDQTNKCDCEEEDEDEYNDEECDEENDCDDCNEKDKSNKLNELCYSNWVCSGWSECINGYMTRSCTDTNNCNANYGKPYEQTACTDKIISTGYTDKVYVGYKGNSLNYSWIWVFLGGLIFIALLILLVMLLR